MVAWFKRPGDSNIPKRKEQLMQWYIPTCTRSEQEPRRKKDDEPPVVDDEVPSAAQVKAAAAATTAAAAAAAATTANQDAASHNSIEGDIAATLLNIASLTSV
jgi:hypothetical protein